MKTIFLFLALAMASLSASANHLPGYYFELVDFGGKPDRSDTSGGCQRPTPLTLTGAKTVTTYDVERLLAQDWENGPYIFDVENLTPHKAFLTDNEINYPERESLPGSVWLPGAGAKLAFENKNPAIKSRLLAILDDFGGSDKTTSLLFTGSGYDCWMSYNAALFAVQNGFKNVLWYRGGMKSWLAANHSPSLALPVDWLTESAIEEAKKAVAD